MAAVIVATMPALKHLIRITFTPPFPRKLQKFHSLASLSPNFTQEGPQQQRLEQEQQNQLTNNNNTSRSSSSTSYFPKRGQTLELVCESLAFKGKGVCKVAGTGFVVMCDRALPGERFIGRVTRRKGSYAEVAFISLFHLCTFIIHPLDVIHFMCFLWIAFSIQKQKEYVNLFCFLKENVLLFFWLLKHRNSCALVI